MMSVEDKTEAGTVRLVQFPKQAVKTKIDLEGLDADADYKLKIGLFGAMG